MAHNPVILVEKLSHHFLVEAKDFDHAVLFYKSVFGAVEIDRRVCPNGSFVYAELMLPEFSFIVSTVITETPSPRNKIIEIQTMDVADALKTALNFTCTRVDNISAPEASRGVKAKVLDPFGFTFAFTEAKWKSTLSCPICLCSPHHLPALCSESVAWNTLQGYPEEQKANFSSGSISFLGSEHNVKSLKQELLYIQKSIFLYKKHYFQQFYNTRTFLPEILDELQSMNSFLQGMEVAIYMSPKIIKRLVLTHHHIVLKTNYENILAKLPKISKRPSDWPDFKASRRHAASAVRQFLKEMQLPRVITSPKTTSKEVETEEARMSELEISPEILQWRTQNIT